METVITATNPQEAAELKLTATWTSAAGHIQTTPDLSFQSLLGQAWPQPLITLDLSL